MYVEVSITVVETYSQKTNFDSLLLSTMARGEYSTHLRYHLLENLASFCRTCDILSRLDTSIKNGAISIRAQHTLCKDPWHLWHWDRVC